MPRMQAVSSNQTLPHDGFSSKDRIPSSKVTGRNNISTLNNSLKQQQIFSMNADLTMVNEKT